MKKKILRIGLYIGGAILIILTIFYFLGAYETEIVEYFGKKRDAKIMEQAESQRLMYLNLQQNDNYGGKTPEETLDLYIEALKALDIELASKYYEISLEEPNLQKREVESLNRVIDRDGDLEIVLDNMDKIIKLGRGNSLNLNEYVITYEFFTEKNATSTMVYAGTEYSWLVPEGEKEIISIALRLNPYTKVWKIIQ